MTSNPNMAASGSTSWVYRYHQGQRVPALIWQDKQWYDVWIRMSDGKILSLENYGRGADIVELSENEVGLNIVLYKAWPWKQAISSQIIMKHLYNKIEGRQEVLPSK